MPSRSYVYPVSAKLMLPQWGVSYQGNRANNELTSRCLVLTPLHNWIGLLGAVPLHYFWQASSKV